MTDQDTELEDFFAAARRAVPQPSDALLDRIMAEAEAEAEAEALKCPAAGARQRPDALGWLQAWVDTLWRPASGLAAAGVAGLAIGLVFPGTVDPASFLTADASVLSEDLYSQVDYESALWTE